MKQGRIPEKLRTLIEATTESLGYELVGVEHSGSTLRIYIDALGGITIDDCERVSHQLSGVLDVEDMIAGPYHLEVSSPGLDRPLFTPEHFARFVGRQVKITTVRPVEGRRKFKALLTAVSNDRIEIKLDDEVINLHFDEIENARLVPDIKFGGKASRPRLQ